MSSQTKNIGDIVASIQDLNQKFYELNSKIIDLNHKNDQLELTKLANGKT